MKNYFPIFLLACAFAWLPYSGNTQGLAGLIDPNFNKNDPGTGGLAVFGAQSDWVELYDGSFGTIGSNRWAMGRRRFYFPTGTNGLYFDLRGASNGFGTADWVRGNLWLSHSKALRIVGHSSSLDSIRIETISLNQVWFYTGAKLFIPNAGSGEFQRFGLDSIGPNRRFFWITCSSDASTDFHDRTACLLLDSNLRPVQPTVFLNGLYAHACTRTPDNGFLFIGQSAQNFPNLNTTYTGTSVRKLTAAWVESPNPLPSLPPELLSGIASVWESQSDGTLLLAGDLQVNGVPRSAAVRLLPNGAFDPTFTPTSITGSGVKWNKRPNDPIRVGWVNQLPGQKRISGATIGQNGGLQGTLSATTPNEWPLGRCMLYHYGVQKFLFETGDMSPAVATNFWQYDTILATRQRFYLEPTQTMRLLNPNTNGVFHSMAKLSYHEGEDRFLVSGQGLMLVNGRTVPGMALMFPNGDLDTTFRGLLAFQPKWRSRLVQSAYDQLIWTNGKLLFRGVDSVNRFLKDGTLDPDFIPYKSALPLQRYKNGYLTAYSVQSTATQEFAASQLPLSSSLVRSYLCFTDSAGNLVRRLGPMALPPMFDTVTITVPNPTFQIAGSDQEGNIWINFSIRPGKMGLLRIHPVSGFIKPYILDTLFVGMDSKVHSIHNLSGGIVRFVGFFKQPWSNGARLVYNAFQFDSTGKKVATPDMPEGVRYFLGVDGFAERGRWMRDPIIQPDGKILLVVAFANWHFRLIRFFGDGRYDPSFLPLDVSSVGLLQSAILGNRLLLTSFLNGRSYQESLSDIDTWMGPGRSPKTGLHAITLNLTPVNTGFAAGKVEQVPAPLAGCNPPGPRRGVGYRAIMRRGSSDLAITSSEGNYILPLRKGQHVLDQKIGNNALQRQICPAPPETGLGLEITQTGQVLQNQNFINQTYACPRLSLNVFPHRFRLCSRGQILVSYFNDGMGDEPNARIRLTLPEIIQVESATRPYTVQPGGDLVFELGNLAAGQRGAFIIRDTIGCPSTPDSTTRACFSARIEPMALCSQITPSQIAWDGAWIDGTARYQPATEQVRVVLRNRGSSMGDSTTVSVRSGNEELRFSIKLAAADSLVFFRPASATGRLQILLEQTANCPLGESSQLFHSGFNTATSFMSFSSGLLEAQTTSACPPFRFSYDPNEKEVFPEGDIQPGTTLDYTIHFENYGNDTAYAVTVVDSLPAGLDFSRFRFVGSSHPCEIEVKGDSVAPILYFHFRNIKLTGKMQDSVLSKGQLSFTLPTLRSLQPGDQLHNRAHIYFDRNDAIITNTVVNKIPLLTAAADRIRMPGKWISVYPNPNRGSFQVQLEPGSGSVPVELTDIRGRILARSQTDPHGQWKVQNLEPGAYFIRSAGRKTQSILVNP